MSTTIADERLYQAYRAERDNGASHSEIKASGVYPDCETYCMRYDLAVGRYVQAMRQRDRTEPDTRGSDFDPYFGRRLNEGNT